MVKDNNPPQILSTAIGFNNMAVVAGGAIFPHLAGVLLHWHWGGVMEGGVPTYSVSDYQVALFPIPLCFLLGFVASAFFVRETHCRPKF